MITTAKQASWLEHYGFRPLDFPTLAGGLSG
jgi:phenylalanyl-tRNA synthetase alpha chain